MRLDKLALTAQEAFQNAMGVALSLIHIYVKHRGAFVFSPRALLPSKRHPLDQPGLSRFRGDIVSLPLVPFCCGSVLSCAKTCVNNT